MEPGVTALVTAPGADIRTDVPLYRVWKRGELVAEVPDIREYWRSDLVTFVIGCSFTFEFPLMEAGACRCGTSRQGRNVPMYDTSIECRSAGAFHSTMVVSMRGIPSTQVADACRISGYYPSVHGAPACVGDPSAIGIDDIMHPDYGDAPVLEPGDVPVFWACGVTPAGRGDGVQNRNSRSRTRQGTCSSPANAIWNTWCEAERQVAGRGMRCVLRRLRQKECCGGGTLRQRNDGKATEGMETMAVQETDGRQNGYANRYEQRYGRKLRSLDALATTRRCSTWFPARTWRAASMRATRPSC